MNGTTNKDMGRRVFISFLGTTNYVNVYYKFPDGKTIGPVRFVQEAQIIHSCKEWSPEDAIYIFCTTGDEGSLNKNWKDNGQRLQANSEEVEKVGLETRLNSLSLFPQVHRIDITDSIDNHWAIFKTVYDVLQDGDEIYFDVTHAYRSIPMFSSVLFNFSNFIKHTTLKEVSYGAFETLGTAYNVRQMPLEERIAPVIDLTDMIRLSSIANGARDLDRSGKMEAFADTLSALYRETSDQGISNLRKKLKDFDHALATCRMDIIMSGTLVREIYEAVRIAKKKGNLLSPQNVLIDYMLNKIRDFSKDATLNNIDAAVNWTLKHGMIQQAYTMAEELTITRVLDIIKPKIKDIVKPIETEKDPEVTLRNYTSAILAIDEKDRKSREYRGLLKAYEELTDELMSVPLIGQLQKSFKELANRRNAINHGKPSNYKFDEDLNKYYTCILDTFKSYRENNDTNQLC